MSIEDLAINAEKDNILYRYKLFAYLFSATFISGFLFDILFSNISTAICYFDFANIAIAVIVIILFYFQRVKIKTVFKYQILGLLANMIFSHYMNPVDSGDFSDVFLRNSITMGMLVPIYGLFCGKKNISHIGVVYVFLYVSSLVRVHDQFLINNAPFLIINGIIYSVAVYYILDILEKMRIRQLKLADNLKFQKDQLIIRNDDLKKKNEYIYNQSKDLKELSATKDKLFSIIAHDLRSPFNSILGLSELLRDNLTTFSVEKSIEYVSTINSTANHTLALLDNLLVWSKIQSRQIVFMPQPLKLKQIVKGIIDLLSSSATIKDITLNYKLSEDIVIQADPNMLQTILRNLVQNAIKFTNTGGKVDVFTVLKENHIEITVADNGIGMNEQVRNKLFGNDASYTTPGTAHESGSGLGLLLCKEFVKTHGGTIWVESEPGEGSRFIFTLPLNNTPD